MTTAGSFGITSVKCIQLEVGEPLLPRRRKRPLRYEGLSSCHYPDTPESFYKQIYYECIDSIVNCIQQRFDQPGYKTYQQMEQLLVNAVRAQDYQAQLTAVIET